MNNGRTGVLSSFVYEFDANGNIITQTEHDGARTSYAYDDLNRLVEVRYPRAELNGMMQMASTDEITMEDIRKLQQEITEPVLLEEKLEPVDSQEETGETGNIEKENEQASLLKMAAGSILASLGLDRIFAKNDKSGDKSNNGNNGNSGNNGNGNGNNGNANGKEKEKTNNGNAFGKEKNNTRNSGPNSNAGGNGYGKYDNPGIGNKYGIYKHQGEPITFKPSDIEATRYMYLGLTNTLHKEYSPKGAPYAEYYNANGQVISQKMFGLHGKISPGREESLKTNGGMMYYQYNGQRSVTELTDRHGDKMEHYRYDAFGNIYTGITAPYNTVSYTGQRYDDKTGLINMNARWYNANTGRFTTEDTWAGDMFNPQSLNRYSYVLNNPVNLWDPTGNVPDWVREQRTHLEWDGVHISYAYYFQDYWTNYGGETFDGKSEYSDRIVYHYSERVDEYWEYKIVHCYNYHEVEEYDPYTGEPIKYWDWDTDESYTTYNDYYYNTYNITVYARDIAQQNKEEVDRLVRELVGNIPENKDGPVIWDINTNLVNINTGQQPALSIVDAKIEKILNPIPISQGTGEVNGQNQKSKPLWQLKFEFEWNKLQAVYWNVVLDSHEAVDQFGQWLIKNQDTISNIPLLGYGFTLGQGLSDVFVPGDYYLKDQEDIDDWQLRMLTSTGITAGTLATAGLLGLDGSETSMLEVGTKVQNTLNQALNWIKDTAKKIFNKGTSNAAPQKVIGHYPEYVEMSNKLGTKPFSIPDNIWNKMTPAEQWAANQKFLDRAIAKGSEFNLATPIDKIRPGSFLQKEIEYLTSQGYKLSSDGTKLVK